MATIYISIRGSPGGGGPSVFVHKTSKALIKKGHTVIYDSPQKSNVALCIIESGKVLKMINRAKTKVVVRLDGAYFKEYWHGKTPDRMWRPDMTALHNAIKRDVATADVMVYQSQFSKNLIDLEIAKRDSKFAIISNGSDTNLFKPTPRLNDGFINILHIGKMRNEYLMSTLIDVYNQLKTNGNKIRLILVGSMDNDCLSVYNKYKQDNNIKYLGPFSNDKLAQAYAHGDIFLAPRQGSSSDNVISEAQACGLPVVVSKWGGNSEMVNDGFSGIIAQNNGHWDYGQEYSSKLVESIEKIIPNLNKFKKQAREHAIKNLSIDNMINEYLKVMEL